MAGEEAFMDVLEKAYDAEDAKDFKTAAEHYLAAAEAGSGCGAFNYGQCCYHGNGVSVDKKKAFIYFKLAHERGFTFAVYNLAVCYMDAIGVERDEASAAALFQTVIDKNLYNAAKAMVNLGVFYEEGRGVEKDVLRAIRLYQRAYDKEGLASSHLKKLGINPHGPVNISTVHVGPR
jgi:TPR repeat protein